MPTHQARIAYGPNYSKQLEGVFGERPGINSCFAQNPYLNPFWKAYSLSGGRIGIVVTPSEYSAADNVSVLPDRDAFLEWRRQHYDGFPDPETGRRNR